MTPAKDPENIRDTLTANAMSQLSIYERIDLAAQEIAKTKFTKTKKVWVRKPNFKADSGEFYTILTIGDILDAVRPAHAKYGVKLFIDPPTFDHNQHESVKIENGEAHARGRCAYRLVGSGPNDMIEGEVPVEAMDRRDKLNNKLITNAERTIYRILYAIDGDDARDPEEIGAADDAPAPPQAPAEDPFFTKGAKQAKPAEEIPASKPAPTETTTDRPRETMLDTIIKASKDSLLRPIVQRAVKAADVAGVDTDQWTDAQVKAIYSEVVKAGRAAE